MKHAIFILLAGVYAVALVGAQDAPEAASAVTMASTEEGVPMIRTLKLTDETTNQVLNLLEQYTDKIILRPPALPGRDIFFDSNGPISRADAVLALESLLSLNGVLLTELGDRFIKAVPASEAGRQIPILIEGDLTELPPSQAFYSKLFRLKYADAETVNEQVVAPLISGGNAGVTLLPSANALLVTDALVNLQRIDYLLRDVDRPSELRGEISFISLRYVGAEDMQERLQEMLEGPLKQQIPVSTSISADKRTNQIIIVAQKDATEVLRGIIKEIDVDAAALTSTEVFPLRQANAVAVVDIINTIIDDQSAANEVESDLASMQQNAQNPQPGAELPGIVAPTTRQPEGGSQTEQSNLLQFSNFVGLSADERTNSIVVYGTNSDVSTIERLIEKLDRPLPQVRIEAIISEVTLNEDEASGLDSFGLSYDPTGAGADYTFSLSGNSTDRLTSSAISGSLKDFSLQVALEAAKRNSNVRILSTPNIVVSHNQEGSINISQSRPVVTASTSNLNDNDSTTTRSQVTYRDIGIKLEVLPLIGSDGTVQIEIKQTVENVIGLTNIDGNDQPIIGIREANSFISVLDGEIIVLGGLQQNSQTKSRSKLAGFRRIPVVGSLFGGSTEAYERTELIIFIQPTILTNPAAAATFSDQQIDRSVESRALNQLLQKKTLGNIYVEGSQIPEYVQQEAEPPSEPKSEPKAEPSSKPRSNSRTKSR